MKLKREKKIELIFPGTLNDSVSQGFFFQQPELKQMSPDNFISLL